MATRRKRKEQQTKLEDKFNYDRKFRQSEKVFHSVNLTKMPVENKTRPAVVFVYVRSLGREKIIVIEIRR